MARPKKQVEEVTEGENIPGLNLLIKEYRTNKMPERKLIALRSKLVSLYLDRKANEAETEFMETILRADRKTGRITDRNLYLLNKKEYEGLDLDKCVVKSEDPPTVHHLYKDLECKYFHDHENFKVIVYIPQKIPAMFQMTNEAAFRLTNGLSPKDGDFPEEKVLIHRFEYNQKEFDAWFEEIEDFDAEVKEQEETYTF